MTLPIVPVNSGDVAMWSSGECGACGETGHHNAGCAILRTYYSDALDFIEAQEWGRGEVKGPFDSFHTYYCLDCGAEKGQPHSTDCWWLACMRDGGRR